MTEEIYSRDNYIECNIPLAHKIGLDLSIYIGEMIRISAKARRKEKLTDGFFTLDRDYMWSRTTQREEQQLAIEKKLLSYQLIEAHPELPATFRVNIAVYNSLMCVNDELLNTVVGVTAPYEVKPKKPRKERSKNPKEEAIAAISTNDTDVKNAYIEWINSVFLSKKTLLPRYVIEAQHEFEKETNGDKQALISMLGYGASRGWKTYELIIGEYRKLHPSSSTTVRECAALCSDVY